MKLYILTDGSEIANASVMTPQQAEEANEYARNNTEGNWYWKKASDLPVVDGFTFIQAGRA